MDAPANTSHSRTGIAWDERFLAYSTGPAAGYLRAEGWLEPWVPGDSPARVQRVHDLLAASGLLEKLVQVSVRPATTDELHRVHDPAYVTAIATASVEGGGDAGEGTPFATGAYEIARLSAGACIESVTAVLDGHIRNAYALVRPAGHHAERDRGRGGCLFANAVVAAAAALEKRRVTRIAIVDWDVHHGNGAQKAFWTDPSVLSVSVHQDRNFPPDTGLVGEIGGGAGVGYNLNVPLPPGSGSGAYRAAFRRIVVPAVRTFAPDLIIVCCGLDASALDPFGRMMLHSADFAELTQTMMKVADDVCDGRLIAVHEGGYAPEYVPFCALAVVEQLAGAQTEVIDPFLSDLKCLGQRELQPAQERVIETCERRAGKVMAAWR